MHGGDRKALTALYVEARRLERLCGSDAICSKTAKRAAREAKSALKRRKTSHCAKRGMQKAVDALVDTAAYLGPEV